MRRRTLEVAHVLLLVEAGGLIPEGVDNVVDLGGLVLVRLLGLLSGSVGANVYRANRAVSPAVSHISPKIPPPLKPVRPQWPVLKIEGDGDTHQLRHRPR